MISETLIGAKGQTRVGETVADREYRSHVIDLCGGLIAGVVSAGAVQSGMTQKQADEYGAETARVWLDEHRDQVARYVSTRRIAPLSSVVTSSTEQWWDVELSRDDVDANGKPIKVVIGTVRDIVRLDLGL